MKASAARTTILCESDWRTLLPVCLRKTGHGTRVDSGPAEFLLRFTASARTLHDGFMRIFGPLGWNDHKFIVLVVLAAVDPEPSTASELATHAAITRASMTDVLDRLEGRRWIERKRDFRDRRLILVKLTTKGRRAVADAAALYMKLAAQIVASLQTNDIPAFERVCRILAAKGHSLGRREAKSRARGLCL